MTGVRAATLCAASLTAASIDDDDWHGQPSSRASGVGRDKRSRSAAKRSATSLARAGVMEPAAIGSSKTFATEPSFVTRAVR